MKPEILDLIIYGAALWRFSHMVVEERGFLDIFLNIRRIAGIVHDDDGRPIAEKESHLVRMLRCVWCSSMFFAIPVVIGIYFFPDIMWWLSLPFALSCLAVYLQTRIR